VSLVVSSPFEYCPVRVGPGATETGGQKILNFEIVLLEEVYK
jgi:hypothetical protein